MESRQQSRKFAIAGAMTGMVIFSLLSSYALTRPCVVGKCYAIVEARVAIKIALTSVRVSASDRDLLAAQQQVKSAIATLQAIPIWSNYRSQAEKLSKDSQKQFQNLTKIVSAIHIAEKATSATKPEKIQNLWLKAIATLEEIPIESQWRAIAQLKIQQYQKNVAGLERQQKERQNGIVNLNLAQKTAQLAQNREDDAQSLSDWQLVSTTWQIALQQLQEISPQTREYQQAKQLLEAYAPRLVLALSHKQQEEFAANIYQKAIEKAKIAQNAELKTQWLTAVLNWRNALALIRQVPKNTFQYRQAEPLITTYMLALDRATEISQNNSILEKICIAQKLTCDYAIAQEAIKINLTSDYIHRLWETVSQARATGNWQTEVELRDRIAILEKNLQSLSNNSGKRVEVYNSDGRLMMVYEVSRH